MLLHKHTHAHADVPRAFQTVPLKADTQRQIDGWEENKDAENYYCCFTLCMHHFLLTQLTQQKNLRTVMGKHYIIQELCQVCLQTRMDTEIWIHPSSIPTYLVQSLSHLTQGEKAEQVASLSQGYQKIRATIQTHIHTYWQFGVFSFH